MVVRLCASFVTSVPCGTSSFTSTVSVLMWVTIMKKKRTVKMRSGILAKLRDGICLFLRRCLNCISSFFWGTGFSIVTGLTIVFPYSRIVNILPGFSGGRVPAVTCAACRYTGRRRHCSVALRRRSLSPCMHALSGSGDRNMPRSCSHGQSQVR